MDKRVLSSYIQIMIFDNLKYAQKVRLEFLDNLFFWEGCANRKNLIERFGISNAQAALDFKTYLQRAGGDAPDYDSVCKKYVSVESFRPIGLEPKLSQLIDGLVADETGFFDELPALERPVRLDVIAKLYRALRDGKSIEIVYQSMTTDQPVAMWIAPVRFGSDGTRVHVRAWSFKHGEYRDYVPSRIDANQSFREDRIDRNLPLDVDWMTVAMITLQPHRRLTLDQKKAVQLEFGFDGPVLTVRVRKALEFYAKRRWGLDQDNSRLEVAKITYQSIENDAVTVGGK